MAPTQHREKRPVIVLGATGAVGQRFVQLLDNHPWFDLVAVAASERSEGKSCEQASHWILSGDIPEAAAKLIVSPLDPAAFGLPEEQQPIAFSALPADVAAEVEPRFAKAGYAVCSNASAFRYEPDVPILVPDVNPSHIEILPVQRANRGWPGFIATNPNCTTAGMSVVLKPLDDAFGLRKVFAATLQAISGAGYPGVPSIDITDNVVPWISGEEDKMARESAELLGRVDAGRIAPAEFQLTAHAHRVPVVDGHTVCLSLGFEKPPSPEEALEVLRSFRAPDVVAGLPSAPETSIRLLDAPDRPQPRLDRDAGRGMTVSVGRVRSCPVLDLRLVLVSHNTIRGAAGGSIVNAELLVASGAVS